ncbi:hypothetical protein AB0383_34645 [Amycolatopsis sp. NPDC051373]|uniref:hypothetical protein n=1 Tax=Amycolatopsis sp. NPDC051373 TaxID=3155801 RepID=UPI00344D4770
MPEEHDRPWVPAVTAAVAGSLAGLADATGSPFVVGAAASAAVGIDAGLRKLGELRARRAIDTCDDAAAMAGIPTEEMLTAILATEGLLDLFGVCVEASARTPLRVKRRILARLLAEGYGEADQSKLENRVYMARILNDLEQPHFAILSELASVETATLVGRANLLDPPQFVDFTLSVLISNGLVRGVDQFLSPQYPTSYSNLDDEPSAPQGGSFAITVLGRDFCRWAEDATEQL